MFPRPIPSLLAVAAAAALLPAAATAAPLQVEQVNRATGATGAFGLLSGFGPQFAGGFGPVTNSGRYSFFGARASVPDTDNFTLDALPNDGIFVRDIVANTTTKLVGGEGVITGLDRSEHLLSVVTRQSFDAKDTNGKPDLYAIEPRTGIKVLISRTEGHKGPALGLTSLGTVARGSLTAVFGTADGVFRRSLLTGKNTRVGAGSFGNAAEDPLYALNPGGLDELVSADGKVVTTSEGIVTPTTTYPLPVNEDEDPEYRRPVTPQITYAGDAAVYQLDGQRAQTIRKLDIATGAITSPTVPASLQVAVAVLLRPSLDGSAGYFMGFIPDENGTYGEKNVKWDFTTGAVTDLGVSAFVSRNEKFSLQRERSGAVIVAATPGNALPGTVELPSPVAYVKLTDRCTYNDDYTQLVRSITVGPELNIHLPKATTVRFRASALTGPVLIDKTVAVPTTDGFFPETLVKLPSTDGAFKLETTITYADGRKGTEITKHVARPSQAGC